MDQIVYTPFDRAKGGIGYRTNQIQTVLFWEELATEEAVARMRKDDYRAAEAIVKALEKFNKDWKSVAPLRARVEVRRSMHKIESLGKTDEGLNDLEALHAKFPGDRFVEDTFIGKLINLSENALRAEDVDQSLGYLARAKRVFPSNQRLNQKLLSRQSEANELIAVAEKTQVSNAADAIAKAQRVVRLSADPELRRRARIVIRNAEGLILHGVA